MANPSPMKKDRNRVNSGPIIICVEWRGYSMKPRRMYRGLGSIAHAHTLQEFDRHEYHQASVHLGSCGRQDETRHPAAIPRDILQIARVDRPFMCLPTNVWMMVRRASTSRACVVDRTIGEGRAPCCALVRRGRCGCDMVLPLYFLFRAFGLDTNTCRPCRATHPFVEGGGFGFSGGEEAC